MYGGVLAPVLISASTPVLNSFLFIWTVHCGRWVYHEMHTVCVRVCMPAQSSRVQKSTLRIFISFRGSTDAFDFVHIVLVTLHT
jgi:hypothetical protein